MAMMMRNSSHDLIIPTTTTSPTWKLYQNPFFNDNSHRHHLQRTVHSCRSSVSLWDPPAFFDMEENRAVEAVLARAQIKELKAELDYEKKSRKKVEIMNKKLARELAEERRGMEALVKVCENLARKIAADKAEIDRMGREMEEERRMLRMAEVLREERVQMKLSDARILWEEKFASGDTESAAAIEGNWELGLVEEGDESEDEAAGVAAQSVADLPGKFRELTVGGGGVGLVENPHIKRGIKGFVEFPRMVHRSNGGSKSSSKNWGTKLECQKAQLRILLKQRSPIRSNTFIIS